MEREDVFDAVYDALDSYNKKNEDNAPRVAPGMMAIEPFYAENNDSELVKVIGVVTDCALDTLDFVCIKTLDGGEMVPVTEGSVWPVQDKTT